MKRFFEYHEQSGEIIAEHLTAETELSGRPGTAFIEVGQQATYVGCKVVDGALVCLSEPGAE